MRLLIFTLSFLCLSNISFCFDQGFEKKVTAVENFASNTKKWPLKYESENKQGRTVVNAVATIKDSSYALKVISYHSVRIDDNFKSFDNDRCFYSLSISSLDVKSFKYSSNGIHVNYNKQEGGIKVKDEFISFKNISYPIDLSFVVSENVISFYLNGKSVYSVRKESLNSNVKLKITEGDIVIKKIEHGYWRKLSVDDVIANYISEGSKEWLKKGKYEKTITYEERVNAETIAARESILRSEIVNELAVNKINCSGISNTYDADIEVFTLNLNGLNPVYVRIPIENAKLMNEDFCKLDFVNASFTYDSSKFFLQKVDLIDKASGAQFFAFSSLDKALHFQRERYEDVNGFFDEYSVNKLSNSKYFALIITVENYQDDNINDLNEPITDGEKLISILREKYSFYTNNIHHLKNPTRADLINKLDEMSKIVGENDNLLIFYAGHGLWDKSLQSGYWLPSDAKQNSRSQWFSNSLLRDYISGIKSKHTLLIADACFSGGIFKTREAFQDQRGILELSKLPSRKAITSGAMNTVPDKSVFMYYLLKRLEENDSKTLSASSLFNSFRIAVINNSPNSQVPLYGDIKETGDEGGDFIFIQH